VADAEVDGHTIGEVDGKVTAAGSLTVTATGTNTATANTVAASLSSLASGAGAASLADVGSDALVEAKVGSGASIGGSGGTTITATGTNVATATSDAGAASFGLSIGVTIPTARIEGGVTAEFDGSISGGSGLTVSASGTNTATAHALAIAAGLFSGDGSSSTAEITGSASVLALVGSTASVNIPGQAVSVVSTAHQSATADTDGGAVGGLSIAVMIPTATVGGGVTANFDGTLVSADHLNVTSTASNDANAHTFVVSIGIVGGGAGAVADAEVTKTAVTEAEIGSDANVSVAHAITIDSHLIDSQNTATATADGGSGGGVAAAAVFVADAEVDGHTIGEVDGKVTAAGSLTVTATGTNTATANTVAASLSALASAALASSVAHIGTDALVEAKVGSGAVIGGSGATTITATGTNDATASSDGGSVGFGFSLTATLPLAEIEGAVRAEFDGTINNGTGLTISADGTNTATSHARAISLGLFAGDGTSSTAVITDNASVEALVGSTAHVNIPGQAVSVTATGNQTATADTAGGSGGGISISIMVPTALVSAGVTAHFDGTLDAASSLDVTANGTDNATSTMYAVSIGFLGGVTYSEADATINGTTSAYLGSSTTIESPGTNVDVHAIHVGEADATASGGAGGALGAAVLTARGTDSPTVKAYVGSGATIGNSNGMPGSLTVMATSTEGTNVNASAGTGGIVSFGGISAVSTLQPSVDAYLAGNDTVAVVNDLTVQAILNHAEGHTRATAYGGGAVQIGSANATSTSNPTVTAYIGAGSTVNAGGSVTVDAESLAAQTGTPLTDNFNADSSNVDQSTGTVEFDQSGLTTGDTVLYVADGNLLPGMRQGCAGAPDGGCIYTVVVVDANHIQFGDTFTTGSIDTSGIPGFCGTSNPDSCPGIDTNRDLIRFASPHNFVTGDAVVLSGSGAIGAPSGTTLYVRVLDPYTVALYTTKAAAMDAGISFNGSNVSSATIHAGNTFTSGERVTYKAAPPLAFNGQGVDVDPTDYSSSDSSAYDIVLGQVFGNGNGKTQCDSSFCDPDGLFTGEKVIYRTTGPAVGGLTNGGTYYVIVVNQYVIQLAASLEDTQTYTYSCGSSCTATHHANPIHITAPSDGSGTQEIVPAPIAGLTDGYTYTVDSGSTSSAVQLDPAGGGGAIGISSQEVDTRADGSTVNITVIGGDYYGNQQLFPAGIALSAPGGSTDELHVDLSGTLPGGQNSLYAPDGTSLRQLLPPPGNGLTSADAEGGGGGLGSFNEPNATVNNNPTVKAYDAATSINAGGDVNITSTSDLNDSSTAQNGSGGLIAASDVQSAINIGDGGSNPGNNNYAFVGDDIGSNTISGDSGSIQVNGGNVSITAGGNIQIASSSFQNTYNKATSSSGGLGDGSHAEADTTIYDNTAAVIGANASVQGQTVRVDSNSSAAHYGRAEDTVYAFAGFSDAYENYTVNSNDTALLDGSATTNTVVNGVDGVDVRAWHHDETRNTDNNDSTCVCIGPSNGGNGPNISLHDTAAGHEGVVVTTGPRLIYGVNENDHSLDSPLKSTGDPHLALYVEAQDESNVVDNHPSQNIVWSSDVVVYDGPAPYLLIGPNGTAVKAVNVTVNCAIPGGVGCLDSPAPGTVLNGIVADIVNDDVGDVQMDSSGGTIGGGANSGSHHWGTLSFWQNFQTVTIINESSLTLQIDNISVIDATGQPKVTLNAPTVNFASPAGFAIVQNVNPTLVTLEGTTSANILLNGTIDNPLGETDITDAGGSILASTLRGSTTGDGHSSLVTTNNLQISAGGSIGAEGGNYVNVDLIQYAGHTLEIKATAGTNIDLDLLTWIRDPAISVPTIAAPYSIAIDQFVAGNDINVRLQGTLYGVGTKPLPGVLVTATPGPSGTYFNYYHDDTGSPGTFDPGAFGTGSTPVASTYNFSLLDAGEFGSTGDITVDAADPTAGATRINIIGYTDVRQSGHIDSQTNGFITYNEKPRAGGPSSQPGDLRVGLIESFDDDVTLNSPGAILDSDSGTSVDVVGRNITLLAGINGLGQVDPTIHGGVGTPADFLDIFVDGVGGALGVLEVTDVEADRRIWSTSPLPAADPGSLDGTYGVFITQTTGDLELDRVVTNGDASLSTFAGSIRDARNGGLGDNTPGDPANIVANNIDLQSVGGSVGDTPSTPDASGNDVKIDSGVAVVSRVGLSSDHGIYVTETSGPLNILFASSTGTGYDAASRTGTGSGDGIRLTTTDTAAQGEDINLIDPSNVASPAQHGGTVLFTQDSPITIAHGLIEAPTAWIMLRSADNVNLGAAGVPIATSTSDASGNTQILGGLWIDVYGDYHLSGSDPDSTYGTVMTLNGTITPGGGCATEIDPGRDCNITQLFGNTDSDTFDFEQTYLGGRTFAYGSNTPTPYSPSPQWVSSTAYSAGSIVTWNGQTYIALQGSTGQDPTQTVGYWSPIPSTTYAPPGDGEDFFNIDQLQTMNVAAGYTLTLDGQAGTDTYTVNTTGSQGCVSDPDSCHNYVVNVLDTGAPTDGVDNLIVDGVNSAQSGYDGNGNSYPTDDIFLLRSTEYLASQTAPTTANALTDDPGFVALLHGTLGVASPVVTDATVSVCFSSANCNPGQTILGTAGMFSDLLPGEQIELSGGTSGIWAGEYTIQSVASNGSSITLTQILPTGAALTADEAPTTDVQLTGVTIGVLQGDVTASDPSGSSSVKIQAVELVNYDTGINGRLTVNGLGGNDAFFVDNTSVTTTLDGGDGNDSFQIGQMYGLTRDSLAANPSPVNTTTNTRDTSGGSLTPADVFGTVATTRGWLSTGNTAPLVAVGGSGDDTFTVYSNQAPLRLEGDDGNDLFVVQAFALAQTTTNGDPNGTACTPTAYNTTTCQIVWLNAAQLIAMPALTTGFSTAAQSDIRTGSGNNQVEYNMNAPVSVDGGTGFNKLVILGTEYADHIVVTAGAIYGAGLSVSYTNIQVLEIDALEGDDTIDVLSTSPGVETRVFGGLGSDTVNVGGDVVGDVFARDIEGSSGTVNEQVSSQDPNYNGLAAPGVNLSVARPGQGQVVITQSDGFTAVYENGCFKLAADAAGTCVPALDSYTVQLAAAPAPGTTVYVTESAAQAPQDEGPGAKTILLCAVTASDDCMSESDYYTTVWENGVEVQVPNYSVVLAFTSANTPQTVFLWAPDDGIAQGNRDVSISSSVLSTDPAFDGAQVTNVLATLYDGDGPGLLVTQLDPTTHVADNVTTVLEGTSTPIDTAVSDLYSVQLTSAVTGTVVIDITPANSDVCLSSTDTRFASTSGYSGDPTLCPLAGDTYTVTFGSSDWFNPVLITVTARNNGPEDPTTVAIKHTIDPATSDSLYSPAADCGCSTEILQTIYANVVGDGPGVFVQQSDGSTIVTECGNAACTIPGPGDSYTVRLTSQPTADVQIAIVTDGQTDVTAGGRISLAAIGGLVPTQLFSGNVLISGTSVKLAAGSELQSFVSDGFVVGERISITGTGTADDADYYILTVATDGSSITLTTAAPVTGTFNGVALDSLSEQGVYTGTSGHLLSFGTTSNSLSLGNTVTTITRTDGSSWLDSGFVEGELVEISGIGGTFKIESFSSSLGGSDNVLQLTAQISGAPPATATVTQWAEVITFTPSNWYQAVTVPLVADPNFVLPPGRQNLIVFAAQPHNLSGIAGPLSVSGGSSNVGAAIHPAVLLPGEGNGPTFGVAPQPPEWQQIDTLNVYDDGSLDNQTGTLTSTALTGLGMSSDPDGMLDLTYLLPPGAPVPFGEPGKYPDGISYGQITVDSQGNFVTDGNVSTIEDLNIMLGQGNDNLTIVSTLVPGPDVNPVNPAVERAAAQGGLTTVNGGGNELIAVGLLAPEMFDVGSTDNGGSLARVNGRSWTGSGFAIGDQVTLTGAQPGSYTVIGFSSDANGSNDVLLLAGGASLVAGTDVTGITITVSDALSVSGTFQLVKVAATFDANENPLSNADEVVRKDGLPWQNLGFTAGETVYITGIGLRTILGFDNSAFGDGTALIVSGSDFSGQTVGNAAVSVTSRYRISGTFSVSGNTVTLGSISSGSFTGPAALTVGTPVTITGVTGTRTITSLGRVDNGLVVNVTSTTITRTSGSWITEGFQVGDQIQVSGGAAGTLTVTGVTATALTVAPNSVILNSASSVVLTITDPNVPIMTFSGGPLTGIAASGTIAAVLVGGDDIVVTGGASTLAAGGPGSNTCTLDYTTCTPSPLVINGDSSQDGLWYGGTPGEITLHDFGPKPAPTDTALPITAALVPSTPTGTITRTDGGSFLTDGFAVGQELTADAATQDLAVAIALTGSTGSITRSDGNSWIAEGYAVGQLIQIDGTSVGTIKSLTASALMINASASFSSFVATLPQTHQIAPASIGTVNALTATTLTLTFLSSNFNQLVADGHSSHTITVGNRVGNGAPFFVFQLGDPYQYSGNDTIDASQAFSKADPTNLPSIGITAYGGPGNDTILGSQTGDILAGGSGNDVIVGGRGQDQIYGDSGINVDPITRQLTIPTVNTSSYADRDLLLGGPDLLYATGPGSTADDPYSSQIAITTSATGSTGTITRGDGAAWSTAGFATGQDNVTPSNITVNGYTITLAEDSALPSFFDAGFFAGQLIQIAGAGVDSGVYTIGQVTHDPVTGASELVLTTMPGDNGTFDNVTIDGAELVTIDGKTVGYLTGVTGSTMTLKLTDAATFAAVNQSMLHVVSVAYYGNYDSVVIGDQGSITQDVSGPRDTTKPLSSLPQEIQTTERDRTIQTQQPDNGANDTIYGNGGDSILIGGTGDDSIDGGTGRALIFGDLVKLDRSASVTPLAGSGCATQLGCFVSPLYQDLSGTEEYSTAVGTTTAGEGALLNDGKPQLDPQGHAGWGDYRITQLAMDPTQPDALVSAGNDYIAGGAGADMIFGELGNDTIQGDGSIDYVAHPYVPIGDVQPVAAYGTAANCTAGAHPGSATVGDRVGACTDPSNALLIDPSVSRATDGGDYIEGGGGNNVIFGDGGQNDIIGGSSDFFGTSLPSQRTSGSNQIFSGSGTELDQEDPGDTSAQGHDADSTVIVGNNGEIIALVGTDGNYGVGDNGVVVGATGFLQYNYDSYTNALPLAQQSHIIVRGVTLLDNTPGGPDLAGQLGPLVEGAKATNGVGDIGGTPLPCNETAAVQMNQPCQQQGNEIHVESGDAFVYGGPANDVIFGGGQNDTIILSYGDNWVSGGRGDQCIVGGGGRCFASRNSSSYGEPLYGIAPIPASSLNELIETPDGAQQAVIYVGGVLMYTAVLYPYNWDPSTWVSPGVGNNDATFSSDCKQNQSCPLYQPNYGHNIIYGGWGSDTIHGGPGQSAISGADAPALPAYTDNFAMDGTQINAAPIETDFYHPFNPGNPMGFNPPAGTVHGNAARATDADKLDYFDPSDPLREILLTSTGANCTWAAGSDPASAGCLPWFLNFDPTQVGMPLDTTWYPGTGDPQEPVTGDDVIFGDLGNDWIVGGMGRVQVFGGWGNDVIDLRASHTVDDGLNDMPVPNLDGTYGTPAWEGMAYGGAGQDIMFAGTAGDRLIDWVGNHNTYYVPFSPFGMPTVSRTLQPQLQDYLYALSKSDGSDQLLGVRYGGDPARNGEPFGELALVLQHDAAWHEQTGPPFNPMPGNLGGTSVDVKKTANIRPLGSPAAAYSIDSLVWAGPPPVGSISLPAIVTGSDAGSVPLLVSGTPNATLTYTVSQGSTKLTGTGMLDASGTWGTALNLSTFPDGTVTVTVILTSAGKTTTLTGTTTKNTVVPKAPAVSVPAYANLADQTAYQVTVTGQIGATATVTITDGATPIAGVASGQDVVGPGGSVTIPIDLSELLDGTLTISVMLTNVVGDSAVTTLTVTKDTVPPPLAVSTPSSVNLLNVGSFSIAVTGTAAASISYAVTDGTTTVSASSTIGKKGTYSASPSLTTLKDGTVTLTVTETDAAGNQSVYTAALTKTSVAPPLAPTVSAPAYANLGNESSDAVTVKGQAGTTANVTITDKSGGTATGQAVVAAGGSVTISVNVSALADGTLTVSATLTASGATSTATSLSVIKDTVPPPLAVSTPSSVNLSNVGSFSVAVTGTAAASISYAVTDGTTTVSASSTIGKSGTYSVSPSLTTLKDGTVTLTVTETDAAGNQSVYTAAVTKDTVAPAVPTVALNPARDSGSSNSDYITDVTAAPDFFLVTAPPGTTTTVYVNGVAYTGQTLAAGTYTITATATDAAGNVSAVATAPHQLVIDTTPPSGSFTFSGAATVNGQLAVKNAALTLSLSFADAHGPTSMAFSTDGGATFTSPVAYASSASVALPATDGLYTVEVRVTDLAGNSVTVSQVIRLDTTGPAITSSLTAPSNDGSYDLTATGPTLTFSATDVDSVQTISASIDGTTSVSSGGTINMLALTAGPHTITITAVDKLGNSTTTTIAFQVHATLAGLTYAVSSANKKVIPTAAQTTLLATLASAKSASNTTVEKSYLATFVTQVQTPSMKIDASYQALLLSWANDLIAQL
jgi:Bacterial Ig-like domain/RTX calcium-binding nonapeptide repeat (4 copies)